MISYKLAELYSFKYRFKCFLTFSIIRKQTQTSCCCKGCWIRND